MTQACEHFEPLISGYIDGELDAGGRTDVEAHLAVCPACRRDFETMTRLVTGTSRGLAVAEPPAEVWDDFLGEVYNRLERRTGWLLLVVGAVALSLYGLVLFVVEPWGSILAKVLVALPAVGFAVLFVSVLRQRLRAARTDRYSREVHR